MNVTTYKQHDRLPEYTATLMFQTPTLEKTPVNLTDATVKIFLKSITRAPTVVVNADAVVVDADQGKVKYAWVDDDLDTPGTYSVEWEVTYSDGRKLTIPTTGYDKIVVYADLA